MERRRSSSPFGHTRRGRGTSNSSPNFQNREHWRNSRRCLNPDDEITNQFSSNARRRPRNRFATSDVTADNPNVRNRNNEAGNRRFSLNEDNFNQSTRYRPSTSRNSSRNSNSNTSHEGNNGHSRNENRSNQSTRYRPSTSRSSSRNSNSNTSHEGNNGHSRNENRSRKGVRQITFSFLNELINRDEPDSIVTTLKDDRRGFTSFLEKEKSADLNVLLVRLLSKVCDMSFGNAKISFIKEILTNKFLKDLNNYISDIETQSIRDRIRNKYFWDDPDKFWSDLIKICKTIFDISPMSGCELTYKLLKRINISIPQIEDQHNLHISDEIKATFNSLLDVTEKKLEEISIQESVNPSGSKSDRRNQYVAPLDDFRNLTIYPTLEEITSKRDYHLNANQILGRYNSVNEYLDVQFRLLREDFIGPLRNGICSRLENRKEKNFDVKFYENVQFLGYEPVNENHCYRVVFDSRTEKKRSFKFENSKRLMFGSLIFFTNDNFKTMIFGKVSNRDIKLLEKGEIVIGFDHSLKLDLMDRYLMGECSVYFEQYYHVLNVLQNMKVEEFPMEKYIINVETVIDPPAYLTPQTIYDIEHTIMTPLAWPDHKTYYGFNESQKKAFKAALTCELAIIQGPPGTGKTYLGLRVAQTLLKNRSVWYKRTPMLVICYTNHALDQFLEGIIDHLKDLDINPLTEIMRVGGQSKNENLKKFNLTSKNHRINATIGQSYRDIKHIVAEVQNIDKNLKEIEEFNCVYTFSSISEVIPNYNNSWFAGASREEIKGWLLNEVMPVQVEEEAENISEVDDEEGKIIFDDEDDVEEFEAENEGIREFLTENLNENVCSLSTLLSLGELQRGINCLRQEINFVMSKDDKRDEQTKQIEVESYNYKLNELLLTQHYVKHVLNWARKQRHYQLPTNLNLTHPEYIPYESRFPLYFYWLDQYKERLMAKRNNLSAEFRDSYNVYNDLRNMANLQLMREHLVVGMTTTGAARLRDTLQALKSPIVIVEEVAEVLESHIIAALTPHCEHLILIGDHQQLKPSTAHYEISQKYKLGISLFERLVLNKLDCYTLSVQHRMRPEISALIAPTIYPDLQNHESVKIRSNILGMDKNLFFIDHKVMEETSNDTSKKNMHEAKFLMKLAMHLILNGYKPSDITILAAYLGQMFAMQRLKTHILLKDVRIAVLDNYQGEESNIILLSLVRSNPENNIGFLKLENRVCVALSRARDGFYMMGNMDVLCHNNEIWPKIKETLTNNNSIGESLKLRCQVHGKETLVNNADHFKTISEGGCDQMCGENLLCGHICKRLCHVEDRAHENHMCLEDCTKLLCEDINHKCKKKCYEQCGACTYMVPRALDCGHTVSIECHIDPTNYKCVVPVDTELPCKHRAEKPCHVEPEDHACPHPCDTRVEPCGHACNRKCHISKFDPDHIQYKCPRPCAKSAVGCSLQVDGHMCPRKCFEDCVPCLKIITKIRTKCPHRYDVHCNKDVDELVCDKRCPKKLPCGHKCRSKCHEPCGPCMKRVEKIVPNCNHKVKIPCSQDADRKYCQQKCPRKLPCGHKCLVNCNQPCTADCKEIVACNILGACGHYIKKIECRLKDSGLKPDDPKLLKYCREPCNLTLLCEHKCSGTCGECFQGRIHKKCAQKCGSVLICNHDCTLSCSSDCLTCQKPCECACTHSKCKKKCGEVCTSCKEKCSRKCIHQKCRKLCGQICDIDPCTEPCTNILACKHPCVGFCGDPCPKLCRICNAEELTEIFFGNEDEHDARFVELLDCGHVLEAEGLNNWFNSTGEEITLKNCPKCKTNITSTLRFSHYLKQTKKDVEAVKEIQNGLEKDNEIMRKTLENDLRKLYTKWLTKKIDIPCMIDIYSKLGTKLAPVTRKNWTQRLSKTVLEHIRIKIQILQQIQDICDGVMSEPSIKQIKLILNVFRKHDNRISKQEISDVELEVLRLERIVKVEETIREYRYYIDLQFKTQLLHIKTKLFALKKYSKETDADIVRSLKSLNVTITETERKQLVGAIGLSRGHWFKCPNGHPYVIGECGGAMQLSNCICGAPIGGGSHTLTDGNRLAPEMDGAHYAAYSEMANNLANWNLDDLH